RGPTGPSLLDDPPNQPERPHRPSRLENTKRRPVHRRLCAVGPTPRTASTTHPSRTPNKKEPRCAEHLHNAALPLRAKRDLLGRSLVRGGLIRTQLFHELDDGHVRVVTRADARLDHAGVATRTRGETLGVLTEQL